VKNSTKNAKSFKTKNKPTTKGAPKTPVPLVETKEPEIDGLLTAEQPLFYFGPPPAIRALYQKSTFDVAFHPQDLIARMCEGQTRSEICGAWGITYSRLNEWLDKFPEFASAYAVAKPAYDAYYKRALRHSAFGQAKGVREGSLFFLLKNQVGFTEGGGDHEFADSSNAELEFVDE